MIDLVRPRPRDISSELEDVQTLSVNDIFELDIFMIPKHVVYFSI